MHRPIANPLVHLELRTDDLPRACALYSDLFGWPVETVRTPSGAYLALELAPGVSGGVVESDGAEALWLPYVEVEDIEASARAARALGSSVLLESREGPAGWRCVIASAAGGRIALWQPKR